MKKSFVITFLLLLICVFADSQSLKVYVKGKAYTTSGESASHVSVYIPQLQIYTITDEEGNYSMALPPGKHIVVFTSLQTEKIERKWVIGSDKKVVTVPDTYLKFINKQLKEVVVTGYSSPHIASQSIYNTRIIGHTTIKEKGATRIEDLLNTTVGIRMRPDNLLGETDFELMGAGGNNLKVLLDGVPLLDRGENKQSLGQIDISSIERIEIVEGPMSVLYGTDALAGVVNIITNNKKSYSKHRNEINVTIHEESLGGTYDPFYGKGLHRQSLSYQFISPHKWYGGIGISHYTNSEWKADNTSRNYTWNPKKQTMPHLFWNYADSIWNVHYRLDYIHERVDISGKEVAQVSSDDKILTDRATHLLQAAYKHAPWKIEGMLSFQEYHRNTFRSVNNMAHSEQSKEEERDNSRFRTWFDRFTFTWTPSSNFSILAGWEIEANQGTGNRISGTRNMMSNALFISADYSPNSSLTIRPGVRAILLSNENHIRMLPSLHIRWQATDLTVIRTSWACGFRAPKMRELYFDFQDSDHNIIGNPNLLPEKSYNIMANINQQLVKTDRIILEGQLGGFFNHFSNRIMQVASTEKDGQYTYGNSHRYKTAGMMIQNRLRTASLSAELTIAYVGKYTVFENEDISNQTDVNRFRFSPEISFTSTWWIIPFKASCSIFYKFTGSRYNYLYNPLLRYVLIGTEAYHWMDITASKQINKWISLQIGVKNVFDISSVKDSDPGAHSSGSRRFLGSGRVMFCSMKLNIH